VLLSEAGIELRNFWVFFGVKPLRACHTPSQLGVRGGWRMELVLKPKPRGLGGASPFPSEGAYSLLLSEKEHLKSKCFQLVGAVGALTPPQPARSFTPLFPAPSQHSWGWTPSGSWGPPQAPHFPHPYCRPAQSFGSADRATQVSVDDFDRGAPTSSTVSTTTSPDRALDSGGGRPRQPDDTSL
jgi:hypothetical protein